MESNFQINENKSISLVRGNGGAMEIWLRHRDLKPVILSPEGFSNLVNIGLELGPLSVEKPGLLGFNRVLEWTPEGTPIHMRIVSLQEIVKTSLENPQPVVDVRYGVLDENDGNFELTGWGYCLTFPSWELLMALSESVMEKLKDKSAYLEDTCEVPPKYLKLPEQTSRTRHEALDSQSRPKRLRMPPGMRADIAKPLNEEEMERAARNLFSTMDKLDPPIRRVMAIAIYSYLTLYHEQPTQMGTKALKEFQKRVENDMDERSEALIFPMFKKEAIIYGVDLGELDLVVLYRSVKHQVLSLLLRAVNYGGKWEVAYKNQLPEYMRKVRNTQREESILQFHPEAMGLAQYYVRTRLETIEDLRTKKLAEIVYSFIHIELPTALLEGRSPYDDVSDLMEHMTTLSDHFCAPLIIPIFQKEMEKWKLHVEYDEFVMLYENVKNKHVEDFLRIRICGHEWPAAVIDGLVDEMKMRREGLRA